MPARPKEEGLRELRKVLDARQVGKSRTKGIEEGSRCPPCRKKKVQGNRGRLSVPMRQKKECRRELKKFLNAR